MIDEELYVLATQELNSDSRREDLWARAIALASDDHDEARYLYTNLRVEELAKERKSESGEGSDLQLKLEEPSSVAGSPDLGDTPSTESLDFDNLSAEIDSAAASSQSDVSRLKRKAEELNDQLRGKTLSDGMGDGLSDGMGDDTSASTTNGNRVELTTDEGENTLETEPLSESELESTQENGLQADDISAKSDRRITNQTGLYIGENEDSHDSTSDLTDIGDDLDPMERTEPEGFGPNDSSLDMTAPDNLPPVQVSPDPYQPLGRTGIDQPEEQAALTYPENSAYPADEGLQTATIDRFDAPIEPVLHSGRAFNVLKHLDGSRRAVKIGSSWPAMLFTLPWLLYKKLWGTALVYIIMGLALIFGVVSTGLNWLDAGADATLQQKLIFGAFALLALIGMFYLPFRQGNQWVVRRLQRKGFSDHTKINAQSAKDALDLARE